MKLLILGATSAIAHETAKNFAADGADIVVVARNEAKLNLVRDDLQVRGAKSVTAITADLNDLNQHTHLLERAYETLGGLDAVLIAHGTLGDQAISQASQEITLQEFTTNGLSYISLLTILGNHFEKQRQGCIAVISSVAGDRGRGSNYVYGSAKSAVTAFTSGLRNRLSKVGVAVVTIKPGFVDTPMTANVKKNALFAKPEAVGKRIYKAMLKGEGVVYVPWFWQYVMMIIRAVPESIFKKLSL
jgi:decaprenylphospho-beta-D-erythro-pentofuranosid-2-ulose 2-reductase